MHNQRTTPVSHVKVLKIHQTNKNLVIAMVNLSLAMCHVFIQNKLKTPPPMDLLSNYFDDFSPKVINIHEVSDEDKNEKKN
jgi:hypothetical protein